MTAQDFLNELTGIANQLKEISEKAKASDLKFAIILSAGVESADNPDKIDGCEVAVGYVGIQADLIDKFLDENKDVIIALGMKNLVGNLKGLTNSLKAEKPTTQEPNSKP